MTNTRDEKAVQTEIKKHPVLRTLKNVSKIQRQTQEKEAEDVKEQRKKEREQREQQKKEKLAKLTQDFPDFTEKTFTRDSVNLKVSQPAFCQYLFKKHHFLKVKRDNTICLYMYNGQYYVELFHADILRLIQDELLPLDDKARDMGIKSFVEIKKLDDLARFFKNFHLIEEVDLEDFDADEDHLALNNGIYNVKSETLQPHDKKFLFTRKIDVDFMDSIPDTPIFDYYLDYLCTDIQTGEINREMQVFLMEYMGAIFSNVHGFRYKKFLFMCGTGNTGKSKIMELTYRILGKEFYATVSLEGLQNNKNMSSKLLRKRLGLDADMSFSKAAELSILKAITGGDPINVERKYIDSFDLIYKGFLWFTSNDLLKFGGDKGQHVYERFLVASFNNVVPETDRDSKLVDKMYMEKQGVVLKCLKAFKNTLKNYEFTMPQAMHDNVRKLQYENSSSLTFFEKYCEKRDNTRDCVDRLKKEHFYAIYRRFQQINGETHSENRTSFEKNLQVFIGDEVIEKKFRNDIHMISSFRSYSIKFNRLAYEDLDLINFLQKTSESFKIDDNHAVELKKLYQELVKSEEGGAEQVVPLSDINKIFADNLEGE